MELAHSFKLSSSAEKVDWRHVPLALPKHVKRGLSCDGNQVRIRTIVSGRSALAGPMQVLNEAACAHTEHA
eukprot:6189963-Pleurochrysis_carterae.AAC.1